MSTLAEEAKPRSPTPEHGLEPCPFCACRFFKGKLTLLATPADGSGNKWFEYRCPKCRTQIAVMGKTEAEAIEAWNRRAEVAALREDNQRLLEAAKRAESDFDILILRGDLTEEPRAYQTLAILREAINGR